MYPKREAANLEADRWRISTQTMALKLFMLVEHTGYTRINGTVSRSRCEVCIMYNGVNLLLFKSAIQRDCVHVFLFYIIVVIVRKKSHC